MTVIVTHKGCNDGLTAAWILKNAFPSAKVIQATYHDDPPVDEARNEDVIVTDVTWPPGEMVRLLDAATNVAIYDHHETAARLFKAPEVHEHENLANIVLDNDHSAARIVWDEFGENTRIHPRKADGLPRIVRYVEDRDLWTNKLDATPAVTEWLYTLPRTVDAFDWAHEQIEHDLPRVLDVGEGILSLKESTSEAIAERAIPWEVPTEDGAFMGLQARGTERISSILGNKLAQQSRDGLALTWWPADDGAKLSLRSTSEGPNVARIAEERWGGGGHANAAGAWIQDPTEVPL